MIPFRDREFVGKPPDGAPDLSSALPGQGTLRLCAGLGTAAIWTGTAALVAAAFSLFSQADYQVTIMIAVASVLCFACAVRLAVTRSVLILLRSILAELRARA